MTEFKNCPQPRTIASCTQLLLSYTKRVKLQTAAKINSHWLLLQDEYVTSEGTQAAHIFCFVKTFLHFKV